MRNPLDKIPKGKKVIDHFKELGEYDELTADIQGLDNDKCLRCAILLADSKSPILSIPSYDLMRVKSLEIAGFEKKGDNYPRKITELLEGKNPKFNEMLTQLFRIYNNHTYELWYTQKANFHYINSVLRQPPNATDSNVLVQEQTNRAKLQKDLKNMANEIAKLEAKLFENPYARDAVVNTAAQKMKNYVEEMATSGGLV